MKIDLGIMQSRLSPLDLEKTYQCFPESLWDNEFNLARIYNFDHIEWIYDSNPNNPLNHEDGYKVILKAIMDSMVNVECICADYFIEHPFWHHKEVTQNIRILNKLIIDGFRLGVRNIVIPCLENSSMIDDHNKQLTFLRNIRPCIEMAQRYMINICLESDFHMLKVAQFMEHFKETERFGICLDTGNINSMGENVLEHIKYYQQHIKHVHLKDCPKSGKNVTINTGGVNFQGVFFLLKSFNYQGTYTLQCARKQYDLDYIKNQQDSILEILENV